MFVWFVGRLLDPNRNNKCCAQFRINTDTQRHTQRHIHMHTERQRETQTHTDTHRDTTTSILFNRD